MKQAKDYPMRKVGNGRFVKDNTDLGIRTEYHFHDGNLTVRYSQRIDKVLDMNAHQRSNFRKFGDGMHHAARVPMVEWNKIMEMCGNTPGHGYDEAKLRRILNDSDYKNLKTIPGQV